MLSERFANSASHQYHHLLPSLNELSTYLEQKICPPGGTQCLSRAGAIASADYLDIDYDSISQALVIKTYRNQSPTVGGTWNEEIKAIDDTKLEIGVLAPEQATEAEELKMGGFLIVIGEDDKPSEFSFFADVPISVLLTIDKNQRSSRFLLVTTLHLNITSNPKNSAIKLDFALPSPSLSYSLRVYIHSSV